MNSQAATKDAKMKFLRTANNAPSVHAPFFIYCHVTCLCTSLYVCLIASSPRSDLNECQSGVHNCSQYCFNLYGSYGCGCKAGYTLDEDGRNCTGGCQGGVWLPGATQIN